MTPVLASRSSVGVAIHLLMGEAGSTMQPSIESHRRKRTLGGGGETEVEGAMMADASRSDRRPWEAEKTASINVHMSAHNND